MTGARDFEPLVRQRIEESVAVKQALLEDPQLIGAVVEVARDLSAALRGGHRLFLFGNGGSAADAEHIAAELVGRYRLERRGLPVYALTANTSSLTAVGNDYSLDAVFARQLEALGSGSPLFPRDRGMPCEPTRCVAGPFHPTRRWRSLSSTAATRWFWSAEPMTHGPRRPSQAFRWKTLSGD